MSWDIRVEEAERTSPTSCFEQVADIHRSEIDGGFLSSLGKGFLPDLYREFAGSSHSVLLVACAGKELVGFICVSTHTASVYKDFLRRAGLKSVVRLAPRLLSPKRLFRALETLLYPARKSNQDLPETEILNFCVRGEVQGKGVGKALFFEAMRRLKTKGISRIKIITGGNQLSAQSFYDSIGARRVGGIEVHRGTASVLYIYDIP